jgi:diguanylate cyclase (GGDEF)-like protein
MEEQERSEITRPLGWSRTSLHFRLTMAMLLMLVLLLGAGLVGLLSMDSTVDRLQRVHISNNADRAAAMQIDKAMADQRTAYIRAGAIFIFALATVGFISLVVARSIRRPLRALQEGSIHFAAGDLSYRVPVTHKDELSQVVEMFNSMAGALETNQQDLSHQAFHDTLTGLPNRSLFRDRLDHALARQARDQKPLAVLLVDLDDFKTVNDSLGHAAGDQLLVAVAAKLHECLRPADTAARLGGDEFAVLVEDMRGRRDALAVANRIIEALMGKIVIDGKEVFVHGSVGIALTYGGDTPEDVLRNADVAMYAAKESGKGGYEVYDGAMHEGALRRLDLKADLSRAVQNDELSIHYQPLFALATGKMVGAEALLRWNHPSRGFVPPAEFVPIADETGLIIEIGRWVLDEACRQASWWQLNFDPEFTISVNISGRQLMEAAFVTEVHRAITRAPIAAQTVTLEITEAVLNRDRELVKAKLNALRSLGVHIAIDDFGTGHSSLGYLRQFPIETIKIDKAFTDGVAQGPEDSALARAILKLADTLGMSTIAEGIETDDQARHLKLLGCPLGQGDYFGPAMRPEELERMMSLTQSGGGPEPDPFYPEVISTEP